MALPVPFWQKGRPVSRDSRDSIRIRFNFRHRAGRIRSVSDHRTGRVWRSRHRSKTPNCLPGARDQVPALFQKAKERRGASVEPNSGVPITPSTFDILRRITNPTDDMKYTWSDVAQSKFILLRPEQVHTYVWVHAASCMQHSESSGKRISRLAAFSCSILA